MNTEIENLKQEIQSLQEENIKLAGELKYFNDKFPHNELGWKTKLENEINSLREEMKKKEEQIRVLFGKCVEKNCERPAVIDYNGHKHYVCQAHYDSLTRYFEEEYK